MLVVHRLGTRKSPPRHSLLRQYAAGVRRLNYWRGVLVTQTGLRPYRSCNFTSTTTGKWSDASLLGTHARTGVSQFVCPIQT